MAREIKKVELRTVDDTPVDKGPVFRLNPGDSKADPEPLIRIEPVDEPSTKLEVEKNDSIPHRSHEPGIEVLIDQELMTTDVSEANWGEEEQSKRPLPWGWFALVGMVLLSAVLWSLSNVNEANFQIDTIKVSTETLINEADEADREALLTVETVERAISRFGKASSIEEMLPLVRHAERVAPLMEDHYARNRFQGLGNPEIRALQPITFGFKGNFWMTSIKTADGSIKNMLLEETDPGEVLIDWETFVCHQPMPWDEYAAKRPAGTTLDFRVHANPDTFFSHEFSDSKQWSCYKLTALDSEETLFGYAPVGSETAAILQNHFQRNGTNPTAMILRLRLPEGMTSRRGVVIEKVMSTRWLYVEQPDDNP
jgi:hypothetical protein